jgi:hypothetical protein
MVKEFNKEDEDEDEEKKEKEEEINKAGLKLPEDTTKIILDLLECPSTPL